jgi:hypothetical protein
MESMKLFTMKEVYVKDIGEYFEGWNGNMDKAKHDYEQYMIWVNKDYKLYHMDPKEEHEELCSWCNYLATIRDTMREELECMDFDDENRPGCIDCMGHVKYWFKRLI